MGFRTINSPLHYCWDAPYFYLLSKSSLIRWTMSGG